LFSTCCLLLFGLQNPPYQDLSLSGSGSNPWWSDLSLHRFHQLAEAIHHIVRYVFRLILLVDLVEKLSGTIDLGLLDWSKMHRRHRALGFSHEIDMLNGPFLERNGPIWVVVAHRRGNEKPAR